MNRGRIASLIGFILLFSFCAESWGADWWKYYADDSVTRYYDAGSIKQVSKDTLRVWDKILYSSEVKGGVGKTDQKYAPLHHTIVLLEINCAKWTMKILQGTDYDQNEGTLGSFGEGSAEDVGPFTVGDVLLEAVCKEQGIKGEK